MWREIAVRPIHMALAVADLKSRIGLSRQPLAPVSRTAIRDTSLLNSVPHIDRRQAEGRPVMG